MIPVGRGVAVGRRERGSQSRSRSRRRSKAKGELVRSAPGALRLPVATGREGDVRSA